MEIKTNLANPIIVGKKSPVSNSWNFDQNKQLLGFQGYTDLKGIYALGMITLNATDCK
jgi:hypothetical protein